MSIKYDSRREPLSEVIRKATVNATYVVPDLQRPFVWTPRQVTMLIDSLFRGWPFGSLLLWEVKPDCFRENEGIPHRPFWQVVDRTGKNQSTTTSPLGQPATYQMLLDGQQRVQSLVLALGGDQWGFQLPDAEWALDLRERRMKPGIHWSRACLCLDLQQFLAELAAKNGSVRRIEAGKILDWVILDKETGQSQGERPPNYMHPLLTSASSPGRFVRLSRFWNVVQQNLSEREYRKLLEPMLKEHGVTDAALQDLLDPLAEFMKVVENIKTNSFVHALQIESFEVTPEWNKDDYSDAIVNIFTRLNTAGRTLTREEITLAWLKVGWASSKTDGKTAGQCLEELKATLADRGFRLETDEIVRLISFIWSVEHHDGVLLDSRDLLKGDIVRSMASDVAHSWNGLRARLERAADLFRERDLVDNQGSFNAAIVYFSWFRLAFDQLDRSGASLTVVQRDSLEKDLTLRASRFLDRWVFGSQWANVWGDAAVLNFQNFASDLRALFLSLQGCRAAELLTLAEQGIGQLMGRVLTKALFEIENAVVWDRRRVHTYYSLLWVWHRLDAERWKCSSVPMRTGRRRTSRLEVDHTVADAWWQRRILAEFETKRALFEGTDEERATLAPDEFSSLSEALAFINLLGNCSLLEKSFNISKSDASMWAFLEQVHEFRQGTFERSGWEGALALSDTLTEPDGKSTAEIKDAIQQRDRLIRRELAGFVQGTTYRVD